MSPILAITLGLLLIMAGLFRCVRCGRRRRRCTAKATGYLAEILTERALLYWPDHTRKTVVVRFQTVEDGKSVCSPALRGDGSTVPLERTEGFSLRYDPQQPLCIWIPGWDEEYWHTGYGMAILGTIIMVMSVAAMLP